MKKALFAIAGLAGVVALAHAAEPLGTLNDVSGVVSVSGSGLVSRAKDGTPVYAGSSVLVASNGKATLMLNNGCTIRMAASQHLVVDAKLPCDQMQASVKQLFPAYRVAQAGIASGLPGAAGSGAGAGAAGTGAASAGAAGAGAAGAAGTGAAAAGAAGAAAAAAGGLGGLVAAVGIPGAIGIGVAAAVVVNEVAKDDPVSAQ